MSNRARVACLVALLVLIATVGVYAFVKGHGFDARATPGAFETGIALRLRGAAIPSDARNRTNPEPLSEENFRYGLAHFADHCSTCHGNNGSGETDFGRGLYPKPPDMRLPRTQNLADGELFYIIERGVPFTGMPGFGTGNRDGEAATWHLVQFIRRLPKLSDEELQHMAELNPMTAEAWLQRLEKGAAASPTSGHGHTH
jgi:mono/diheme cytochrome c family protein